MSDITENNLKKIKKSQANTQIIDDPAAFAEQRRMQHAQMGELIGRIELEKQSDPEGTLLIGTNDAVIKAFNPLYDPEKADKAFYFTYRGAIICREGHEEDVQNKLDQDMEEFMHGSANKQGKSLHTV